MGDTHDFLTASRSANIGGHIAIYGYESPCHIAIDALVYKTRRRAALFEALRRLALSCVAAPDSVVNAA